MKTPILVFLTLAVLGGLGVLVWWFVRKNKKAPQAVPTYSSASKQMFEKYFSKTPANPSSNLNEEFKDTLRLVKSKYNDDMLERCFENETNKARIKAIDCAFYKTAVDWITDPTSVEEEKLLQLFTLNLIMRVDNLTEDTTPDRSKLVSYDKDKELIQFNSATLVKDLKPRLQYVMIQKNVSIPSAQAQMNQADNKPFTLPIDAYFYTMLETMIKQIPTSEAKCKLCNQN